MKAPILIVALSVPPDKETDFNEFYQHQFLPRVIDETPEFVRVVRYEEFAVGGTLRWYNKQYLTIYELSSEDAIAGCDSFFGRPAVVEVVMEFRRWKDEHLKNFSRIAYKPGWAHRRQSQLAGAPWMFLWQLEMKPDLDASFQTWYQDEYLPLQVADIGWSGCHRYESVGKDPLRHLTMFEAADEAALSRCLTDLRSAHRISENYRWQERVEPAVTWHDATSFKPVYRWPD